MDKEIYTRIVRVAVTLLKENPEKWSDVIEINIDDDVNADTDFGIRPSDFEKWLDDIIDSPQFQDSEYIDNMHMIMKLSGIF